MIRILRSGLVGLLLGTVTYTTISVYSVVSEAFNCLKIKQEIYGPCKPLLLNLQVPGQHELILAVVCSLAGMAGAVVAAGVRPRATADARGRLLTGAQAALVAVALTGVEAGTDSAIRGPVEMAAVALALLGVWYIGRDTGRVWEQLGVAPGPETLPRQPAFPRLFSRVLTGLALTFLGTTALFNLASTPYMVLMRPEYAALAAAIYALAASGFLILAHYAALRATWGSRPVIGGRRLVTRWVAVGVLLLAAVGGTAEAAPIAANHMATLVAQVYAGIARALAGQPDSRSCATDEELCGKEHPARIRIARQRPHAHHPSQHRLDLVGAIVRLTLWLIPLMTIFYLFWKRRSRGRAGPLRRLVSALSELRRWYRRRSSRLRLDAEMRLLRGLADRGAAVALLRRAWAEQLSVRQQIVRYYLNALTYAHRFGMPRDPAQTPEEFEETLRRHLDSGHAAWSGLTAAFLAARYSPESPSDVELEYTRSAWHLVRAAIRRAARPVMGRRERVKIS
jgi:hypothetical protein